MAMLATSVAQSAPAQPPTPPPSATAPGTPSGEHKANHKAMRDEMAKLNLSDDQKSKIKDIRAKSMDQAKAVKADTTLTDAQKKAKMRDIRKDTHKQISGVLTPEQRKQWKEDMKQHHAQGKDKTKQPS
jgi:protein CpxP